MLPRHRLPAPPTAEYDCASGAPEPPQPSLPMLLRAETTRVVFRSALLVSCLALGVARPLDAQNLRQRISDLFIFGEGQEPLFLAGSGDPNNPVALQAHGLHFIPSSSAENSALISTIGDALG